jgi:2'-5' RNA ligase
MTAPTIEAPEVDEELPVVDSPGVELPADTSGIPEGTRAVVLPVMVVEGMDTADGRYLEPGGLTHRALPISLLAQVRTPDGGGAGHDNAHIVGAITEMVRRPGPEVIQKTTGEAFPEGTFVWSGKGWMYTDVPEGKSAFQMVMDRALSGNSVDLSDLDVEFEYAPDVDPNDPNAGWTRMRMRSAIIAASTLVPQPAFADAYVEVDGELMVPDGGQVITASAVSFRAIGVDTNCAPCALGLGLADDEEEIEPGSAADPDVQVEPDEKPRTDGMIALVPADASPYVVDGGDPAEEMHVTLAYLGDNVNAWTDAQRTAVHEMAAQLAEVATDGRFGVEARVFGHAQFNPDGGPDGDREACAVYLLGDSELLTVLRGAVIDSLQQALGSADYPEQHEPFVPHMTAGYGVDVADLSTTGPIQFGAIRVALGGEVVDYPIGGGEATLVAAAPAPLPAKAFHVPEPDGPQALAITEGPGGELLLSGHIAAWGVCHIGFPGQCRTAPRSPSGYAYFHTGAVLTDAGELAVGQITLDAAHAELTSNAQMAARHYDHTGTAAADVRLTDGEHGIWASGIVRGTLSAEQLHRFRASAASGDWRAVRGALEMVAVLSVNVPGFPVPRARVASGAPISLVAAGALAAPVAEGQLGISRGDRELLAWARDKMLAERQADALAELDALVDVGALHEGALAELDELFADWPPLVDDLANWVEKAGGLPKYIKRISEHLESKGMDQSQAIATAVNAAKKMCATGDTSLPGDQDVNPGSRAEACAAVEEWNAKKAAD